MRRDPLYHRKTLPFHGIFSREEFTGKEPSHQVPRHFHHFLEFVFVLRGRGRMDIDGVTTDFAAPAVYVARPYGFHSSSYRSPFRIVVFSADVVALSRLFEGSLFEAEINRLLNHLSFAKASPQPFVPEVIRLVRGIRGLDLAGDLGRFLTLGESLRLGSDKQRSASDFPFTRLLRHLQENLANEISLSEAARLAGMKLFPFVRAFKKNMGMTFVDFLTSLRLGRSEILLRHSMDSVTEIAGASGFRTLSHFNRMFRRRYGVSPGEFRRQPAPRPYS